MLAQVLNLCFIEISPEILVYGSDQSLTQTQMITLKVIPNPNLNPNLTALLKKINKKCVDEYTSLSFYFL